LTTPICTLLAAGIVLLVLIVDIGSAKTFTVADFEGTWNVHGLGIKVNSGAWGYGTFIFENTGKFTGTYITSTGHTESPKGTLSINKEGVISALPDFGTTASSLHGVMSNKKDVIVCTHTGGDNSYKLMIFAKSAGTFATSDLQGTWVYHGLISGNEPDQVPGWYYGSITIDRNGNAIFSNVTDSEGNKNYIPYPDKFSITEDGLITMPHAVVPYYGAMNQSKDMIVSVATMAPGEEHGVRGYNLAVAVKQIPGSYTINDLASTWYVHALVSGSSYDDWTGWYYATSLIDRFGNGNWVAGSYLNCRGETDQTWTGTMSITNNGIITISNLPTYHGIINLGKDICVGTMNDGGGGYGLAIGVGRPAIDEFDFDMDGDVDFVDFANFADHWLK